MSAQIDELLDNPGSLDRADREIVYHHLMTPQPNKGQLEIPSKKSLLEEVRDNTLILLMILTSVHRRVIFSLLGYGFLSFEVTFGLKQSQSDTVGNTTTLGTFLVLNDDRVHQKLVDELIEAWPNKDEDMSYEVLEKLPYLVRSSLIYVNNGLVNMYA